MKRIHIPAEVDYRYRVQNPSGRQRSFRILKFRGPEYIDTVENDSLDAINTQFKAGTLSKEQARTEIDALVEVLYRQDGVKLERVVHNKANQAILDAFLSKHYKNRELVNEESSIGYFRRAVEALGELSILVATQGEMQTEINKRYPDHRQRRIVDCLNIILKDRGREDVQLVKRKKSRRPVRHIPLDRIEDLVSRVAITEGYGFDVVLVSQAFKTMCRMAIYTGCRIGELLALKPSDRMQTFIHVTNQRDRNGDIKNTKTGEIRKVAPFPEAFAIYDQWMREKKYITPQIQKRAARIVLSACRRAFPNDKAWHLCFHDLRHSFAIACLEHEMSLEMVARNLGNAIHVSQEYYSGYVHNDVTVDHAFSILSKRRHLKAVSTGEE